MNRVATRMKLKSDLAPNTYAMKDIAYRLRIELSMVYNWKNRKRNPLPTTLNNSFMVKEKALLNWLADQYPELILIWQMNKPSFVPDTPLQRFELVARSILKKAAA